MQNFNQYDLEKFFDFLKGNVGTERGTREEGYGVRDRKVGDEAKNGFKTYGTANA